MKESQSFKVDRDDPCGRAGYEGGKIELYARKGRKVFTDVDSLLTNFTKLKLDDGDEVEITVEVKKRRGR